MSKSVLGNLHLLNKILSYSSNSCIVGVNKTFINALAHNSKLYSDSEKALSLLKVARYVVISRSFRLFDLFISKFDIKFYDEIEITPAGRKYLNRLNRSAGYGSGSYDSWKICIDKIKPEELYHIKLPEEIQSSNKLLLECLDSYGDLGELRVRKVVKNEDKKETKLSNYNMEAIDDFEGAVLKRIKDDAEGKSETKETKLSDYNMEGNDDYDRESKNINYGAVSDSDTSVSTISAPTISYSLSPSLSSIPAELYDLYSDISLMDNGGYMIYKIPPVCYCRDESGSCTCDINISNWKTKEQSRTLFNDNRCFETSVREVIPAGDLDYDKILKRKQKLLEDGMKNHKESKTVRKNPKFVNMEDFDHAKTILAEFESLGFIVKKESEDKKSGDDFVKQVESITNEILTKEIRKGYVDERDKDDAVMNISEYLKLAAYDDDYDEEYDESTLPPLRGDKKETKEEKKDKD